MKWFKYLAGSLKDPMIADLIAEFGGDGYLVFFGILDMMAEDFDENNPGVSTFNCQYLTRNLQVSRQKLVRILSFLQNYPKNKGKLLHKINGNKIIITCKRFEELADDWTKRLLRSSSEVTTAQEEEEEVNKDISKKERKKENEYDSPYQGPGIRNPLITERAKKILTYLNEKRGTNYTDQTYIEERLIAGASMKSCILVIDTKMKDSHFQEHPNLLNPKTLFKRENFDRYVNEKLEEDTGEDDIIDTEAVQEKEDRKDAIEKYRTELLKKNPKLNARFKKQVIDPLKNEMYLPTWETFIEDLVVVSNDDGRMVLFRHAVDWINDHYKDNIEAKAKKPVTITSEIT